MANTILGSLLSASQTKFKSDDGQIVWEKLFIKSVSVDSDSSVTDNPIQANLLTISTTPDQTEREQTQRDNDAETIRQELAPFKIINPVKVRVEAYCKNMDMVTNLRNDFADDTLLVHMMSKSIVVKNLVMTDIEFEHTPEMTNATKITMSLEQAFPYTEKGNNPEQGADSDNYGMGVIVPMSTPLDVNGLVGRATDYLGSFLPF